MRLCPYCNGRTISAFTMMMMMMMMFGSDGVKTFFETETL